MARNHIRAFGAFAFSAAVLSTPSGSAWSAPNKCTGKDGKVTYTEQPCAQNQTQATVRISAAPAGGQGSRPRTGRLAPGQQARCEQARAMVDALKKEIANGRHKDKADLVASAREEIAKTEQLIHQQCD